VSVALPVPSTIGETDVVRLDVGYPLARRSVSSAPKYPPTHQNPPLAPPIPIISLSSEYIGNASVALSNSSQHVGGNFSASTNKRWSSANLLAKRGFAETCGPGNPCPDGR